ncbi:MAG: hypothetical protein Q8Q89_01870 [bacterium]|nr:hypothetical protein [bacterium]
MKKITDLFRKTNVTVTLQVEVRPEDISGAPTKDCTDCPVSRAVIRAIRQSPKLSKYFNEVRTHLLEISLPYTHHLDYWGWGFDHITIPITDDVGHRIELYDETKHMEPFAFTIPITIPRDALKLGTNLDRHQRLEHLRSFFTFN